MGMGGWPRGGAERGRRQSRRRTAVRRHPVGVQDGVDRLLADEPEHARAQRPLHLRRPATGETRSLTLRGLLFRALAAGHCWPSLLVAIVSVVNQAGPTLIGIGINDGIGPHKDMAVIVVVAVLYLVCGGHHRRRPAAS